MEDIKITKVSLEDVSDKVADSLKDNKDIKNTTIPHNPSIGILSTTVNETVATIDENALHSQGQREVNLIWENTQMKIALSVIWAALIVASVLSIFGVFLGTPEIQLAAIVFLFGVANLVTGFYFGRTNHQRVGGITSGR